MQVIQINLLTNINSDKITHILHKSKYNILFFQNMIFYE